MLAIEELPCAVLRVMGHEQDARLAAQDAIEGDDLGLWRIGEIPGRIHESGLSSPFVISGFGVFIETVFQYHRAEQSTQDGNEQMTTKEENREGSIELPAKRSGWPM